MGRYGMTFARELIEQGDYEEAEGEATKEIDLGRTGPRPWFDRGVARDLLERHEEAAHDFERAHALNLTAKEMDPFEIDDAYFSTVLSLAQRTSQALALEWLARYRELFPSGGHVAESRDWEKRLRGELPSLLDKTKDADAVQ
jgi:tetratricopeptide (TPR) repeat protein